MHWAVVLQGNEKDELQPFYGLTRDAMTAIGVTHLTPDIIQLNPLQNKKPLRRVYPPRLHTILFVFYESRGRTSLRGN